jgi:hypothetical protein
MEKMWAVQVSRLKVSVRPFSRKSRPTRETITTMRTWAITKASRLKVVLLWTKTIQVMVMFMSELRQSTKRSEWESVRERARRKIRKLITIWVFSIIKAPPLNPLVPEVKLIQVTLTATKHANEGFHPRLGGFFPHFSLRVEGRLWVGWIVSFGRFDCFILLVVSGARNELGSTLLTLILTPLKTNIQFVCGFGCTLLNPTQIILNHLLTQNSLLKTCSQIGNLLLKLDILFGSM